MYDSAIEFVRSEVSPRATELDASVDALKAVFQKMKDRKLLALRRPHQFGENVSEAQFRRFQEEASRASGAFAFLQTQHQSAVSLLGKHADEKIRYQILPKMSGEYTVGLGFSQLRRTGEPLCKAVKVPGGYELSGHVPWVTGLGFFDAYLIGAALESGEAVFGLIPLASLPNHKVSEPMRLTAMETCQTVTIDLDRFHLAEDQVAFVKDPGWIRANDSFNITLQGHFAIGCAMAGIDVVRENAQTRRLGQLNEYADSLENELNQCREALVESQSDFSEATSHLRLQKRAWTIDLMMRCAHAAVVSSSGSANYFGHPAGRILREAIVFSVSAQTQPIMMATLDRLTLNS